MGVTFDIAKRHSPTANSLILWVLQSSRPTSALIPKPELLSLFCTRIFGTVIHNSAGFCGCVVVVLVVLVVSFLPL